MIRTHWLSSALLLALGVALGWFLALERTPQPQADAAGRPGASAETRLRELKIDLPEVAKPKNTFVVAVRAGDMLYVSGSGPGNVDGKPLVGRLGKDMDVKEGRAAARLVGLQILAVVKHELGSLDKVERLVKTLGMVNATPDFKEHPLVINGFSDLMVDVFGPEMGKGARSAVGMVSLPGGIPVEIEAIFQVRK